MNTNFSIQDLVNSLDRTARTPLKVQLYDRLRVAILEGHLSPGTGLPPSRQLSDDLSVSRTTVLFAIEQLTAEGYVEPRRGAGVFVSPHALDTPRSPDDQDPAPQMTTAQMKGSASSEDRSGAVPFRPFQTSVPDQSLFPHKTWARLLDQAWRNPHEDLLGKPDTFGWWPLREGIANHLRSWRGVNCHARQVVITSGSAEAFELISASMLPPRGRLLVEDPGYKPMHLAFQRQTIDCLPCPIDDQGMDVDFITNYPEAVDGCAITPSRHYPLGMTVPVHRRLALLQWAKDTGGLIIEDDYDSEFRFTGQPLPALASLDDDGRIVYVGSFSKVLSTSLRLAYMVVPDHAIIHMERVMSDIGARASLTPQPALAEFINNGAFSRHIRRMRRVYAKRRQALVRALSDHAGDLLEVFSDPSGMHLWCGLAPKLQHRMDDKRAAFLATRNGISATAVSDYYIGEPTRQGLVLGYAGFEEDILEQTVKALARVLRSG